MIRKGPKPIPNVDTKDRTTNFDKESFDITKEQEEVIVTNARAISLLYCAVSGEEYGNISKCETAKEMWDKLKVTYEGTTKVRENKIDALQHEYEAFMMKDDENIEGMFARLSKIICELKSLEVTYTNSQQVRKLVRSLPKPNWETKAIVLKDRNLDVTYDKLRGNLMTFEKNHINRHQKEEKKKVVAFKTQVEEFDDDFKEEEVAMISRSVVKAMRRSRNNRRGSSNFRRGPPKTIKSKELLAVGLKMSETQELLDQTLADLNKVFDEYRKLQREKKDWELKLEVAEIERDLRQEEI
ncbi:uncharacterized protein LOC132612907 [Lycium barbarum]|uniref:uncharacterized protein LOC132612907 n=1 Tax=Lycium barbarum TaxID=112863 RepID=UPI00293E7751|nr:uncharacterized protein LOC132612907 [Lycium barbarum]